MFLYFFFLMIRRPPRSTLFPTRRSSDLKLGWHHQSVGPGAWNPVWGTGNPALDKLANRQDRKSTRLNSSHVEISYAVFCLKKKKKKKERQKSRRRSTIK